MSEPTVLIDNKEYITATEAGRRLGYTKEYMLMLAKHGKIEGKKIGNKWYVFFPSVEEFFAQAKKSTEERLRTLSEVRKKELSAKNINFVSLSPQVEDNVYRSDTLASVRHARVAVLEILVIVFLGVSVGALGYVGISASATVSQSGDGFFKYVAQVIYDFFNPNAEIKVASVAPKISQHISQDSDGGTFSTSSRASMVVAPDNVFSTTMFSSVQESFSDEVEVVVDDKNPNTGVIIPKFVDGDGEAYRFMMVPVNTQTQ